jgi:hypothetical protein
MPKRGAVVVENYQRDDSVRTDYPPAVVDPDKPQVRKLVEIQNRYRGRNSRQTDAAPIMPWAYPKRHEERRLTY